MYLNGFLLSYVPVVTNNIFTVWSTCYGAALVLGLEVLIDI